MPWQTRALFTLTATAAMACGAADGTRPEDMSAEAHRQRAADQQRASREHRAEYDPRATRTRVCPRGVGISSGAIDGTDYSDEPCFDDIYNPTDAHRRAAARTLEQGRPRTALGGTSRPPGRCSRRWI